MFEQAYTLHVPPAGNLAGHGLAILLMKFGLAPETCEKLLMTLCVVGLALAFRYAVASTNTAHPAASLLVMPFLYNWPMQMGFWSFSLGVPFLLVSIGLCIKYRGRWTARSLLWLFLAAGLVYLCHPISWAVCGLVIALMAACGEWRPFLRGPNRRRALMQTVLPIAMFVPFAIPNLLFATQNELVKWDRVLSFRTLLWPLYTDAPLHIFESDARAARALFLFLVLASFVTLVARIRSRRLEYPDVLLGAAALLFAMGLLSPGRIGEGTFLGVRLLLFGYLVWALWLGLAVRGRMLTGVALGTSAIAIWLTVVRLPEWRMANRELSEVVRLGSVVPEGSYLCEVNFRQDSGVVMPLEHAVDLLPEKRIVDVRDYEAGRQAFWTSFRPGYFLDQSYLSPATQSDFEGAVKTFENTTGKKLDYIVLLNMKTTPEQSLRALLPATWSRYEQAGIDGPVVAFYRLRP
ncbi:MAG: hypothetical protein M3Y72_16750 [Acidobacteriota bacterium]|nr:hypothetical protein [Acidobacteriota bacterium]